MTDCPNAEIRDLLPDLVHGTLDADARALAESHLRTCDACRAELQLLRAARGALNVGPRARTGDIIRALPAPPRRRWGRTWYWAAAAALLIVAGGLLARPGTREASTVTVPPVAVAAPTPTPAVPSASPVQVAAAPGQASAEPVGLSFAGGVSDLDEDELKALLSDIDNFDVTPRTETEPTVPVLVGASATGSGA
jgi:anti-sigma factor RsiW